MEWLLFIGFLIVSGIWTKYTNGLYMRKLAVKDFLKHGKPLPECFKNGKPIFAWWEF